jgi:hypothetical protein
MTEKEKKSSPEPHSKQIRYANVYRAVQIMVMYVL